MILIIELRILVQVILFQLQIYHVSSCEKYYTSSITLLIRDKNDEWQKFLVAFSHSYLTLPFMSFPFLDP